MDDQRCGDSMFNYSHILDEPSARPPALSSCSDAVSNRNFVSPFQSEGEHWSNETKGGDVHYRVDSSNAQKHNFCTYI
jgi:hypothetical protein